MFRAATFMKSNRKQNGSIRKRLKRRFMKDREKRLGKERRRALDYDDGDDDG